jgi:UPF0716 protein FxsA
MVKWLTAALLLLPLAEIAAFAAVAAAIGLGRAFVLAMLTSIFGALVLRQVGRGRMALFRAAVSDRGVTGIEADVAGLLTVLAGLLLLVPGFLTDIAGVVLLIGPLRRACAGVLRRWIAGHGRSGDPAVVDLAPGEWRQVPERRIENDSNRREGG